MKRFVVFLALLAGAGTLRAQSDLRRADFFEPGDLVQFRALEIAGIQPGAGGKGVVWDFRATERASTALDYKLIYTTPTASPHSGSFPQSNMISIRFVEGLPYYTYYYGSGENLELQGFDTPENGIATYGNKAVLAHFPIKFGVAQSDTFTGQYETRRNGVNGTVARTGQLNLNFDGYGTLYLPDGKQIDNVRRLKRVQSFTDVFTAPNVSTSTREDVTSYEWYVAENRNPLFIFSTQTTTTQSGSTQKDEAYYQETEAIIFPAVNHTVHLATEGGDFDTDIIIHNPSTGMRTLRLSPLASDGSVSPFATVVVGKGKTVRAPRESLFNAEAASFTSSGCSECTHSVGYRAASLETAAIAHVHQNKRSNIEFVIYPGEWEYIFDGAAILNVGDRDANVEAVLIDNYGIQVARVKLVNGLAPGAKKLAVFNTLFPRAANTVIRLESTQPISVLMLRGDKQGHQLYQNLPLPDRASTQTERWIPHITSESGGFNTDIFFYNSSSLLKSVTVHPYTTSGVALQSHIVVVNPNSYQRFAKTELVPEETSHMRISGDTEIIVSVGYRAQRVDATTAHIHEVGPSGKSFKIYPGDWDVINDGFALINVGTGTAELRLIQIHDDGKAEQPITLRTALQINGKYRGQMDNLIPYDPNSIIKIESTQPLVIMALRLSKDGRFLYSNEVLPP